MERFEMNAKRHHKHKQHPHRQPDPYELYELEHMPHELTKASIGPRPRHILKSDEYYDSGTEAQPYWRPLEGANGVILGPDYYESGRNMQPYPRSTPRGVEGDCGGDVDCMADKFIEMEHEKFEHAKWMSMKK